MEALLETTVWGAKQALNHTYLLDGNKLVAYVKAGETAPFYFKNPIKGFDKRGRKFVKGNAALFKVAAKSELIEIKGSKGNSYFVDVEAKSCTCPGYAFRGACKHIAEVCK